MPESSSSRWRWPFTRFPHGARSFVQPVLVSAMTHLPRRAGPSALGKWLPRGCTGHKGRVSPSHILRATESSAASELGPPLGECVDGGVVKEGLSPASRPSGG